MIQNASEQYIDSEAPPDNSPIFKNKLSPEEAGEMNGSFLIGGSDRFIVEVVSDIERSYLLWEEFSPKNNLFETWEFRYAFYRGYGFKPYFILLKNKDKNLALLPLWYDEDKNEYQWFGSDWQEETSFFAKDPSLIPILLSLAPSPIFLNAISKESLRPVLGEINLEEDMPKYILNLDNLKNHEDFLMTMKKSRRHDLRKDRRRIERQNPEIVIDNFNDIDELIALAKGRFKNKGEETDWEDQRRIKTFKEVIALSGRSYKIRMIKIKINGQTAGVDLICLFNNTYYAVKCGYDVKNFSGIGNFMNLLEIDDAINLGMKKFDLLQNNYQWKDRWFQQVPLVKYKKNI